MSHVDEGALHAYLDGALDEYPTGEAQRVREHLASCAECAERLERERRVRDEASRVLALAIPDVDVPSLEELREYVRAMPALRTRVSVRLYRLGWAASVALALGTGWMLRDARAPGGVAAAREDAALERPGAGTVTRGSEGAVGQGVAADAGAEAAEREAERPAGLADAAGRGRAAGGVGGAARSPEGPAGLADAEARQLRATVADAEEAAPTADEVAPEADEVEPAVGVAAARAEEVATAVEEPATAVDSATAPVDDTMNVPGGRTTVANTDDPADPAGERSAAARLDPRTFVEPPTSADAPSRAPAAPPDADRAEPAGAFGAAGAGGALDEAGTPLAVPGLEVLEVASIETGAVETAGPVVRVLQRLEGGDTLTLFHLPEGVEPSSLPRPNEHLSELVVPRRVGRLVMRAPVGAAALSDLLTRLDSVGGAPR